MILGLAAIAVEEAASDEAGGLGDGHRRAGGEGHIGHAVARANDLIKGQRAGQQAPREAERGVGADRLQAASLVTLRRSTNILECFDQFPSTQSDQRETD